MKKTNNLLWGIVLIVIGIILGLNALEITSINIFFDGWWTLFIIIPSIIGLINDDDKVGNIFGLFIGLALLLICQNIIDFDLLLKLFLPIILIFAGLSLIFKNKVTTNIKKEVKRMSNSNKKTNSYCSTFSSMNIKLDEDVEKYELDAVFGELNVNLSKQEINEDLLITACSIFGSIRIEVPNDIEVKLVSTPIFGEIKDKRKKKPENKKCVVYVDATAIFGGVEIR
mgnify:FL=1